MITFNGKSFAKDSTEFNDSCVGFYRVTKNHIDLLDSQKVKVGVVTKQRVLALATKLPSGKYWYSYGDIPIIGAYGWTPRVDDVARALSHCYQ